MEEDEKMTEGIGPDESQELPEAEKIIPFWRTALRHSLLFLLTLAATTAAGAEWMTGKFFFFLPEEHLLTADEFWAGLHYSLPFLGILTVHEFGHYFMARRYRLEVSLPYFMPMWLGITTTIGTLGAFIRIKSPMMTKKEFFDVGIAGPLAGFVAALFVLFYGFTHLPAPEHIFTIHPEYAEFGLNYAEHVYKNSETPNMVLGTNLLFEFFKNYVADPSQVPDPHEIMHYPYLLAGFLSLFFTALNLIPIGQLDGGHILYGLLGYKNARRTSFALFCLFVGYAGLGLFSANMEVEHLLTYAPIYVYFLYWIFGKTSTSKQTVLLTAVSIFTVQFALSTYFTALQGYSGWLLFAALLGRMLGVYHPQALIEQPLGTKRKILGWLALIIFILCFSPEPLRVL